MVTDLNGNVYVAGYFMGKVTIGALVLEAPGGNNEDSYVIKYDTHGNILWVRHITGTGHQVIHSLAFAHDGIIATGSSQGVITIDGITIPNYSDDFSDTILLKFGPNGNVVMGKNIGYNEVNLGDIGFGVTTDQNGNIYVAGGRGRSMYFCKLTSTGDVVWRRTYGSTNQIGTINAGNIIADHQGSIYASGHSRTGGGNLFKINSSGTFLWTQTFVGDVIEFAIDNDNNLLLTADIYESTTIGQKSIPFRCGLIGKMNPAGVMLWHSAMPEARFRDVALNKINGEVCFSGSISQDATFDGIAITLEEDSDVLIGSLSKNGVFKWVSKAGEENRSFGDLLNVDPQGNIFIAEGIQKDSVARFQCVEKMGQSKKDMYVAKIAPFLDVPVHGPIELCEGEEGIYSFTPVSDYISYEWFNDNPDLELTTVNATTIKIIAKGKKFFSIGVRTTIDLGCEIMTINHAIPVTINSFVTKATITGPSEVCPGSDGIEISVSSFPSGVSYQWILQDNVTVTNSSTNKIWLDFEDDFSGTEIGFHITGACNDVTSDPIAIAAKSLPGPIDAITTDALVCDGIKGKFQIAPVPNATSYRWVIKMASSQPLNYSGSTFFEHHFNSADNSGSIYVNASNECGEIKSPVLDFSLNRRPSQTNAILGPGELCPGTEGLFVTSATTNANGYHWIFTTDTNAKTFDTSGASNQLFFPFVQPGTLTVRSVNACGEGPVVSWPIKKIVDADIQPKIERNCNILSYATTSEPLSWFKDGTLLGTDPTLPINSGGTYELRYIGQCIERSTFVTITDDEFEIFVPNIFTPNGDSKNETFHVSKYLQGSRLAIFNRWGNAVYTSDSYNNGWDGRDVASGVYYYMISSICGGEVYKGTVSVVK